MPQSPRFSAISARVRGSLECMYLLLLCLENFSEGLHDGSSGGCGDSGDSIHE